MGPGGPSKAKVHEPSKEMKTVQGTVQRFTTAPKGKVHGFVLSDGTEVHYPPHLEKRVLAIVAKGDRVRVTGRVHTGLKGDTRLETDSVTNLGSQATITIDHPPPPRREEKK